MEQRRAEFIQRIDAARERQLMLHGSERDVRKGPDNWIATAVHYLGQSATRAGKAPDKADYEDSLIAAAAVILAALEHSDHMFSNEVK